MSAELTPIDRSAGAMAPDWIVLGVKGRDCVLVYASTELSTAELRMEVMDRDPFDPFRVVGGERKYQLSADLRKFVVVMGKTYAEAMANLMGMWEPDEGIALPGGG